MDFFAGPGRHVRVQAPNHQSQPGGGASWLAFLKRPASGEVADSFALLASVVAVARAFVASYLPKISDRLWNQTRDRDVYLLKALQKSTYDIQKQVRDVTLAEVMRDVRTVKAKNEFTTRLVSTRNASTDWGVCKATRRQRTG